ncbi:hypothetical protein EMIHUDRAFT_210986 [Emiliania huxleyi CCMP1516]|uniref:DNA repair protein rad9 n=2 Tax=Emiliania huxleyi TaxID=2903 RepID=A0A0D3IXM1_EMIH1|nr:hypothetical protein EMIHUDRAFT_210986 [Emiliania huxleyi CCMP1516]EOD16006.1 hypothetical protein EMIHUDRAFT_210986 [Emiliania huxleyi CCMP1516]|eukprot:XP_005768435.1 hypothetical protein EMIHUDRAFT_210986 [Emiliania huxleyi CCMP1516]
MASDPFTLQFCVDDNLRIFARMLACLDRVGKDLYLEASGGQVSLRTLNAAQSAFVKFHLRPDFFAEFVLEPNASLSMKVYLKNLVPIFRSVAGVSKVWVQVASGEENYLRVQQELRKKFDLAFEEVTMINAVYSPDSAGADALTLRNDPDNIGLDDQKDVGLRTELSISPENLHAYMPNPASSGVSALLSLVKELEHRAAGQPILLSSEPRSQTGAPFSVESVLATVVEAASLGDEDDMFGDEPADEPMPSVGHASGRIDSVHSFSSAVWSDTEEEEDAVPGTPPGGHAAGASAGDDPAEQRSVARPRTPTRAGLKPVGAAPPSKRPCVNGSCR